MIPAWLKKYLEVLTTEKKFGVCHASCVVSDFKPSGGWSSVPVPQDTFTLQVPYASDILEWLVMFDGGYPDFPPDFIFDCRDFFPSLSDLRHLTNWDPRDTVAFSNVMVELYNEYRKYQASLLSMYPRLETTYKSILQVVDEELVEVHLPAHERKGQQTDAVVFLIRIDGPFEKIPAQRFNDIEGADLVILKLYYSNPESSAKPVDSICISSRLSQALGHNIQFPALYSSNIPRYITELKEFLSERIDMLDSGLSKRQAYIEALRDEFEGAVLEIDTEEYISASVLINFLDFHFILQVLMPTYFPKEQPKLIFRSVYHTDESDRPFSKSSKSYPWSPRWSSQEMIKRLQTYIAEVIPNFQRASVMQGTALKAKEDANQPPPDYEETYSNKL